jgi:hypothetical protein
MVIDFSMSSANFYHRVASGWGAPFLGSIDTDCHAGEICNNPYGCHWTDESQVSFSVPRVGNRCPYNPSQYVQYDSGQQSCLVYNASATGLAWSSPDTNGYCPPSRGGGDDTGGGGDDGTGGGGTSTDGGEGKIPSACYQTSAGPDNAICGALIEAQNLPEKYKDELAYCKTLPQCQLVFN